MCFQSVPSLRLAYDACCSHYKPLRVVVVDIVISRLTLMIAKVKIESSRRTIYNVCRSVPGRKIRRIVEIVDRRQSSSSIVVNVHRRKSCESIKVPNVRTIVESSSSSVRTSVVVVSRRRRRRRRRKVDTVVRIVARQSSSARRSSSSSSIVVTRWVRRRRQLSKVLVHPVISKKQEQDV